MVIQETGDVITSSPVISSDGTVYIGSWDSRLYALRLQKVKEF